MGTALALDITGVLLRFPAKTVFLVNFVRVAANLEHVLARRVLLGKCDRLILVPKRDLGVDSKHGV